MRVPITKPDGEKTLLYMDGNLNSLLQGAKEVVHNNNTSIVILNDGKSGLGKTTLSFQQGIILDDNFNLSKVHFTPESFLRGLAEAKKGEVIIFDEALVLSSRSTLSEINKMVVVGMSMIRSKNIFVIFNVNSIFDLDKNLAIFRADFLCHVYAPSLKERGRFATFFRATDGFDRLKTLYLLGKKYYDYTKPKANFIGRFSKEFIVDEKEYEKLKQIGVNNFLNQNKKGVTKKEMGRNKMIRHLFNVEGWKVEKICEISGLKQAMVYTILKNDGKTGFSYDSTLQKIDN